MANKFKAWLDREKKAGRSSLRRIADKAGCNVSTVWRLYHGKPISGRAAIKISRASGLDLADILQKEMFQ